MKSLGIDYGEKIMGLTVSDASGLIALGHGVIERTTLEEDLTQLSNIIQTEKIGQIVIGLPKKLDNTLGRKAEEVLEFVEVLKLHTDISIIPWDERLTTVQAERMIKEIPLTRAAKRKHLNTVSAQLILQSYLDAHIKPAGDRRGNQL